MPRFELVTLSGVKFSEDAHEIILPTPDGQIAIFPHHAPLVSLASPGVISIRVKANHPDDMMEHYATTGGVIEIIENTVRLLTDESEHSEEINEAEAKKAFDQAQAMLKDARDPVSLEQAQSLVDREATRIKVAGLKRRHTRRHYR